MLTLKTQIGGRIVESHTETLDGQSVKVIDKLELDHVRIGGPPPLGASAPAAPPAA